MASVSIFLCGDVMTGRAIDQILPYPVPPKLYESYIKDARDYIRLAEEVSGDIETPVGFDYVWGDALPELRSPEVDLRIINLETSITTSEDHWRGKPVLYRMSPRNVDCLRAAGVDCCVLGNNHVLDWGYPGLIETLETLEAAGVATAGAGRNRAEAKAPAVLRVGEGRVLVYSFGTESSGVPYTWAAHEDRPGVNFLPDLSQDTARTVAAEMLREKNAGDILVASIHWGSNWGYRVPREQIDFAHRLVDEGISVVHGHSSHHVRPIELYGSGLILYGCGDFLSDYEGIAGYEAFRDDLTLMYFLRFDALNGRYLGARLLPMQMQKFRLQHASNEDAVWLAALLNRLGEPFLTKVTLEEGNAIIPSRR